MWEGPYKKNEDWLGCEKSEQFLHASCIGVNFAEILQDPFFYCPSEKTGPMYGILNSKVLHLTNDYSTGNSNTLCIIHLATHLFA